MWQLIVAVLGLGFAGWQLLRTANATVASQKALEQRLLHNDLLVLLPEMHLLEDAVERAVRAGDRDASSEALMTYSRRASAVVGELKLHSTLADSKATKSLAAAGKMAGDVKQSLYDEPHPAVAPEVAPAQERMRAASREISEVIAQLKRTSNESGTKGKRTSVRNKSK